MATRSTIAQELADGSIRKIYCHWDGYLSNNGLLLLRHWTDPAAVSALIDQGDLSSLGSEIGEQHDFNKDIPGVCTFYGRDRGETGVEPRTYASWADYLDRCQMEEYNYCLRQDGQWWVTCYETNGEWEALSAVISVDKQAQIS